jgi:DNA-binding NarL/FixJ family response regulator
MHCMELSKVESSAAPQEQGFIRLMLIHGRLLLRESLARLLASEREVELVAECATTTEALKHLRHSPADLILLDISIAKDFIVRARQAHHRGRYLVLANTLDATASAELLKYGASGIFMESDSPNRLMQAIHLVAGGEAWVGQKVVQLLAEHYPHFETRWNCNLTAREQSVLRGVVDGLSNKRIGVEIGVSESTIKAAVQQLFRKAGVRTRSQLVRIALEGQPGIVSAEVPDRES